MPKSNGGSKTFLYLIALTTDKFVGSTQIFFSTSPHIETLGKTKPYPHFQNLPPASQKKKPLSRRVNHALIAAFMVNTKSLTLVIIYQPFNNI